MDGQVTLALTGARLELSSVESVPLCACSSVCAAAGSSGSDRHSVSLIDQQSDSDVNPRLLSAESLDQKSVLNLPRASQSQMPLCEPGQLAA
jgi:hypothetical protein